MSNDATDPTTDGLWQKTRRRGDLAPNPALWAALDNGAGLRAILVDFYSRVYADDRLAHFFEGTTIARAIEKQHSFLMELFTGRKVYFGDRPRNAHHWMVISDELFDYREALMESCLRRHGLSEEHIAAWRAYEEVFRKQIVKAAAVPKKIRGVAMPLDGYDWVELSVGSVCDQCEGEIDSGLRVAYHLRTGKTFCSRCGPNRIDAA